MNGFAKGWTLKELKNVNSLITKFIVNFRFDTIVKNDLRFLSQSEFIQMRYINTCQIISVTDNNKWKKFSRNMILNDEWTEETLDSILNMSENKRKELLFLLIGIVKVTHSLNQKSNNPPAEIKLLSGKINDLYNEYERFLEVTLSNADYQDLYIKHCNEEDRQIQNELNQKKRIFDKKESEESKTNEYDFHRKNAEELAEKERFEELEHYRKEAEAKMYKEIAEKKSKELAEKKRFEELEHYRKEAEAKMYKEIAEKKSKELAGMERLDEDLDEKGGQDLEDMNELLKRTKLHFKEYQERYEDIVVSPSLPILYFGDSESYFNSECKVITVGKNPSDAEFRENDNQPFSCFRFPNYDDNDIESLRSVLDNYFNNNPYTNWFQSFEPLLNGLGCSYYEDIHINRVLHTDICSPIATSPTWTGLDNATQNALSNIGREIWKDLVCYLKPDIIIVSIAKRHLPLMGSLTHLEDIHRITHTQDGIERANPYILSLYELEVRGNFKTKLIFGQAAQTPFGIISDDQKRECGDIISKFFRKHLLIKKSN